MFTRKILFVVGDKVTKGILLADAGVTVSSMTGLRTDSAKTNRYGVAVFEVMKGLRKYAVKKSGYKQSSGWIKEIYNDSTVKILLEPEFVSPPPQVGIIIGTFIDATAAPPKPISDVTITVTDASTKKEIAHETTGADGYFKIAVPPGKYIVDISYNGYKFKQVVDVAAGQTVDVTA